MKKIVILTLFPEFYDSFKNHSIIKKAINSKKLFLKCVNIRDYSFYKNNQVDDYSYGGGSGMVMMCEPIVNAIENIDPEHNYRRIFLTPIGKDFNNKVAREIACNDKNILILCGHYEGIDERIKKYIDEEFSVGNFILTGGEVASLPFIDAITRFIPGVININSVNNDSFENNMMDYPHYTKPRIFRNINVPDVLLSGDHEKIKLWRKEQSIKRTKTKQTTNKE